ncbi:MAG: hypothetical protein PHP69_04630 [Candidatus Omnitrophica bacterium]|nr:hypothetical protein [Candidatus Omnitrophota bacterium]MDD5081657.1 hypothetical protein [Candidatus Omnitrophota bacterium]
MNIFKKKTGQISIFFISLVVTLIGITFVTIVIGKTAKDKTYTANSVDAGAISAASAMAYGFNYVANANKQEDKKLKKNFNDFQTAYNKYFDWANINIYTGRYIPQYDTATTQQCCVANLVCQTAQQAAKEASKEAENYKKQINETIKNSGGQGVTTTGEQQEKNVDAGLNVWADGSSDKGAIVAPSPINTQTSAQTGTSTGVIPNYWDLTQKFYEKIREVLQDDQEGKGDVYHNALYLGYIYGFRNSGTSLRLGKINQKRYSQFLQEITPDKVRNGEAKTFDWTDGAGRSHATTVIVNIADAKNYNVKFTQMDRSQVEQKLNKAMQDAEQAKIMADNAAQAFSGACGCDTVATCPTSFCGFGAVCNAANILGRELMKISNEFMQQARQGVEDVRKGLDNSKDESSTSKKDTESKIIKYLNDIQHSRTVNVMSFQFHMGGPVKGMRGDVDIPVAYPPVTSSATASFRGNGDIGNAQPSHEVSLISAN